ncbi:MerR family transcriptional regulator [Oceanobacillus chungangensis]|uniref:HTH merR-type domain-containing protein n=1 Tax=Oceanobacillus chungangensis TaxID=1229152 RepID=A0A3D8PTK7_9BACI|nr:MerR family transcriptional regulator [Oceanobacillus chungangensis]RDW18598.1 hypothetical protein CWR45_09780 [Oceanobacillus chungangensis]
MKIGEFSRVVGLSKDTIRYYEKIGLIKPKVINKHRYYKEKELDDLAAIIKLIRNGFSLDEIKRMFQLAENVEKDQKLDDEALARLMELIVIFENKNEEMLERERILVVKAVLERAIGKNEYMNRLNRH